MEKAPHNPLLWIPTLSAAEEIPTAVVTYVSLLMFVQFGFDWCWASFCTALLLLPSVLKSYLRSKLRHAGHFKRNIHYTECLLFCSLMALALYINYCSIVGWQLFLLLLLVSLLCSVHELLGQMYYNRMLYPRQQKLYNKTKIFASQATVVITYGVLIISAGFLEVFFRSVRKAWAMESCLVAGAFMVFAIYNVVVMQNPRVYNPYRYESLLHAFKNELRVVERIRSTPGSLRLILAFALLLLPQALMFNTRVFFLLATAEQGGLDCSLQDVGFAQGTIGVLAFSVGAVLGRILREHYGIKSTFWLFAVPLTLSPVFYMMMSQHPLLDNMLALCLMTFSAQFCFGFGLNGCMAFVHCISGERYRNTVDYLYIPLVASVMLLPMALSGWLVTWLGFKSYFLLDACCAPVAWLALGLLKIKRMI
ncbi:MAG: hypothetical protein IJV06_03430 [Bacteroidaceae bacterium]|nr:hypothetical protein [Bacteroidaceae bacterium]